MTNQYKEGDTVWLRGQVTNVNNNYCTVVSEGMGGMPIVHFAENLHPAPVADYPARVTEEMVEAWRAVRPPADLNPLEYDRACLQAALDAAPPCQSKTVTDRQEVDQEFVEKIISWTVEQWNARDGWNSRDDKKIAKEFIATLPDPVCSKLEIDPHSEEVRELLTKFLDYLEYGEPDSAETVWDFLATLNPPEEPEPAINLDHWELPFFAYRLFGERVAVLFKDGLDRFGVNDMNGWTAHYKQDGTELEPSEGRLKDIERIDPTAKRKEGV